MAEPRPDLGPRKSAVLRALVEEYVRSGEPVGSETIAERAGLGVSSATIRNEMAALEELGYLQHPHTSAGRIPTDAGYRHYVDSLPVGGRLREQQRRAIAGYFAEAMLDLEEVLKGSVQLLSRMTQYAGLAVPPSASEEPIVRLELIDMGPTIMVLAVGQHGRVDKRIVDRPEHVDAEVLAGAELRLAQVRGMTYGDAQARLLQLAAEGPRDEHDLVLQVADTLRSTGQEGPSHMVVGGVSNLADEAQLWRRETVRRLFEALERESEMLRVLEDVRTTEVAVTIGGEHPSTG
jgi:heat-inducible transcriptional repressor